MRNIFLIGAGRSSSTLIKYFLDNSDKEGWRLTVGDLSLELAEKKINRHPNARAIAFDMNDPGQLQGEIERADLVISMLPATMHLPVAKECIRRAKNMVTASYVSDTMRSLDAEARRAGVLILNECGLDPGIDHMSAMKVIDEIRESGGQMLGFKSYCGGLIAPESNDNPWGYKFTWNPRAVVMAGQSGDSAGATAQFLEDGKVRYVPYQRLFTNTEPVKVEGLGKFESYANRDSLSYIELYGLQGIQTMLRGTLRMPGFCKAWNAFIQLGLTDDNCKVAGSENITYADLIASFLPSGGSKSVKKSLAKFLKEKESSPVMKKLEWLGILGKNKAGLKNASPAEILLDLLMKKWSLKPNDKDMVVMKHEFTFKESGAKAKAKVRTSSMVVYGDDQTHTAMSKTVGLPLGISAGLILSGKISSKGVQIPTAKDIYLPVLQELEKYDIQFIER